jgi:hypothetical protein
MEVSGQLHDPATLPTGKELPAPMLESNIPAFAWRNWGIPRRISVKIVGVPANI